MSETNGAEITITIPVKQATVAHIEQLQATLTKRNVQIEQLAERLREAEAGEPNQNALEAAYKRGWKAACDHLMGATHEAALALRKIRKDAFDVYLNSESRDFNGHQ